MLVLNSPKPDVFLAAGNQLVRVDWTELDSEDVEVTDLFSQQLGLLICLYFADVKDEDGLALVGIETHHRQVLLVA